MSTISKNHHLDFDWCGSHFTATLVHPKPKFPGSLFKKRNPTVEFDICPGGTLRSKEQSYYGSRYKGFIHTDFELTPEQVKKLSSFISDYKRPYRAISNNCLSVGLDFSRILGKEYTKIYYQKIVRRLPFFVKSSVRVAHSIRLLPHPIQQCIIYGELPFDSVLPNCLIDSFLFGDFPCGSKKH